MVDFDMSGELLGRQPRSEMRLHPLINRLINRLLIEISLHSAPTKMLDSGVQEQCLRTNYCKATGAVMGR